ncbi:MAG: hypothetical protein AAGI63_13305 [Planctomycetota bacterium]
MTKLRDTLTRSHALEAFRHLRGGDPRNDDELEAFIEDYVRDAYSDGVEDWDAVDRVPAIQRHSMDAPLGRKLRAAGFDSLWSYFHAREFQSLDIFRSDLDSTTLAPVGFHSYIIEAASEDGNWELAVRVLATDALNTIRSKANRDFIAFMAVHRIALDSPTQLTWIKYACDDIVDVVQQDNAILDKPIAWDDKWLVDLVATHAANGK